MKVPVVYILTNAARGTLYVGVTSDLIKRVWQHREGLVEGFTKEQALKRLVWFEPHATMMSAIVREKAIKKWRRVWKLELVETSNPEWLDLWSNIVTRAPATEDGFPLSRE
jgi:putative endonuclease